MKQLLIGWFIVIIAFGCNSGSRDQKESISDLEAQITSHFAEVQGDFALAFELLDEDSIRLLINDKAIFHAASTMKTPVMIELFKQVESGNLSMDDSVKVINQFSSIVDGSPYKMDLSVDSQEGLYHRIGKNSTYRELNYEMITRSSNLATNILIEKLDAKNISHTMRELGAMDIEVLRGVEDLKAFDRGLSNTTNAYDLMLIMKAIATGKAVSKSASESMIKILEDQHFRTLIPRLLPKEVIVAHKTGGITGVRHDSAIVTLPDGRQYVLVILSKNLSDEPAGEQLISEVSRMIYDFLTKG